jgi:hypothetical protein
MGELGGVVDEAIAFDFEVVAQVEGECGVACARPNHLYAGGGDPIAAGFE